MEIEDNLSVLNRILTFKGKIIRNTIKSHNVNDLISLYPPIYYICTCTRKNPKKLLNYIMSIGCNVNVIINDSYLLVSICEKLVEICNPHSASILKYLLQYVNDINSIYFKNESTLAHYIYQNYSIFGYKLVKKISNYHNLHCLNMNNINPFELFLINTSTYPIKDAKKIINKIKYLDNHRNTILHSIIKYYNFINPIIFSMIIQNVYFKDKDFELQNKSGEIPFSILIDKLINFNDGNVDNIISIIKVIRNYRLISNNNFVEHKYYRPKTRQRLGYYIFNPNEVGGIGIIHSLCQTYSDDRYKLIKFFESIYSNEIYNILNIYNKIPLSYAKISYHDDMRLIEFVTLKNVNHKFTNGNTLLHILCENLNNSDNKNSKFIIQELLVVYDANVNILNDDNKRPLDLVTSDIELPFLQIKTCPLIQLNNG